jgi:hypothetical protein
MEVIAAAVFFALLRPDGCAVIPPEAVTLLPRGYWLQLHPGEHPAVDAVPVMAFIPYDSPAVAKAPDGQFRACIANGRLSAFFAPGEVL